ncbi:MAG: radical SAM protein [bacterium]
MRFPRAAHPLRRITYGPVPSRRLGRSLGIDLLPMKSCSYDCVYCQLGPTLRPRFKRMEFIQPELVGRAVRQALEKGGPVDVLSFSGSGEPTLDKHLGTTIRLLKRLFGLPIAVITNGSLLYRRDVREALREADLLLPSMDGWTEPMFRRINRPHPLLKLEKVLDGLVSLRKEFKGQIWLEVFLVQDVNDSLEHVPGLIQWLQRINPDRVQLNSLSRPPAEAWVRAPSPERIKEIRDALGPRAEIVVPFKGLQEKASIEDLEQRIVETVTRRPLCPEDLSSLFGLEPAFARRLMQDLSRKNSWKAHSVGGRTYYRAKQLRPGEPSK